MLSVEELKLQFKYDETTGVFTRKAYRDCHKNLVQCDYVVVGKNKKSGYFRVSVCGVRYLLHKLAILYATGNYPCYEVDHIDGDMSNNKYSNLRHVGRCENRKNLKLYKNNKSGVTGVHEKDGKYYAQIRVEGVNHFRGYFNSIEEAIGARFVLNEQFKFHENHGKR